MRKWRRWRWHYEPLVPLPHNSPSKLASLDYFYSRLWFSTMAAAPYSRGVIFPQVLALDCTQRRRLPAGRAANAVGRNIDGAILRQGPHCAVACVFLLLIQVFDRCCCRALYNCRWKTVVSERYHHLIVLIRIY